MGEKTNADDINSRFNEELDLFLEGKIGDEHIFRLGKPGELLQKTGFPVEQEIELTAKKLKEKSTNPDHPYNPEELKDLVKAINEPIAVFSYGDSDKAQNVIIEVQHNGKNFLTGIHFDKEYLDTKISNIRTLFPKDNHEWLNWISQGKLLYANIEKLHAVVTQQQINSADVSYLNMEPIKKLLQKYINVKHFFARCSS